MKKYQKYMDEVTVSDTLHEKLKHLEKPKQKPVWQKYGALAAAVVLVLGIGALGLGMGHRGELGEQILEPSTPAISENAAFAPVAPPMPSVSPSPNTEMMGGYEVRYGEGENATVAYFYLPYIQFGEIEEPATADMAPPVGVYRRDLTAEEIEALFRGQTNLITHLGWSDYTLYAHAMLNRDGSLWMLCVTGIKSETEHFTLEIMPGALPPSCLVYMESVVNNIWDREVTAECYHGEHGTTHRVSFMNHTYGYRFELSNGNAELVPRLVRWIIAGEGLRFAPDSAEPIPPSGSEQTTMPYDPNAAVSQGPVEGPVPTPVPTQEPTPES